MRLPLSTRSRTALLTLSLCAAGCTRDPQSLEGLQAFAVDVLSVNGAPPPSADAPLPANRGDTADEWEFTVQARDAIGNDLDFDGWVRLSVNPGSVLDVTGAGASGRNIQLVGGAAQGVVRVTRTFGAARLWVEDIGYAPNDVDPACANGTNDDASDQQPDYPGDFGCAFANDDNEEPGTYAAGLSEPVHYDLPRVVDIQGESTITPYKFLAVQVKTGGGAKLIVTRVSSDGFYATDLGSPGGYNHIYSFNFNTPPGMRVCDRLTYFAGTANEFFGGTQVSFPSYFVSFPVEGETCEVPEPVVLPPTSVSDPLFMEPLESGLVRIEGFHIAANFGPGKAVNNVFGPNASNCDLNDDGQVDFENDDEASCANACGDNPECSEWISYAARGNYKVTDGTNVIQINTGTVSEFDPTSFRGQTLTAVTGTVRNFSGGSLNWTIETRCPDDLVCTISPACVAAPVPSTTACVRLRTIEDNDEGTN